jgi:hypothetical protein
MTVDRARHLRTRREALQPEDVVLPGGSAAAPRDSGREEVAATPQRPANSDHVNPGHDADF